MGALEQGDRAERLLGPLVSRDLGFRPVTAEVPQRLPVSDLLSIKDFRVTAERGDRLSAHLSDTRSRALSFEAEKVKYVVCGDL